MLRRDPDKSRDCWCYADTLTLAGRVLGYADTHTLARRRLLVLRRDPDKSSPPRMSVADAAIVRHSRQ